MHRIREFLSIWEGLVSIPDPLHAQNKYLKITSEGRISGYFCSDTVFNLSHRTETEVLKKSLDCAPIQKEINKPELRKDFSEFAGV